MALTIVNDNVGKLEFSAKELAQLQPDWSQAVIEDYLNIQRYMDQIAVSINGNFGTMALQDADNVQITGGTINNVTLDNVQILNAIIDNITVLTAHVTNLTVTGSATLNDVTVTGYFHSPGITDDATTEQINITDSLVDIHQDTDLGQSIEVSYVTFDGTNDYLTRGSDLTGIVNGKAGTIAARIRFGGGDGIKQMILNSDTDKVELSRLDTNKFLLNIKNPAASSAIIQNQTVGTYTAGTWYDILISWNAATGTKAQMYINDVDDAATATFFSNNTLGYSATDWRIGRRVAASPAQLLNADMAFLWFDTTTAIDFSVEANRRKFFGSSGIPVDLGPTGAIPTGTAPIMYFNGDSTSFPSNKGTGGGMTLTGTLTSVTEEFGVLHITDGGYYTDSATSGDMGSETFNSLGYYQNGVYVPTISSTSTLTNKTISLDSNTLTATSGANGQIPIYGTTAGKFDNATITAGVGISVTNADTSITLATTTANEATDTSCFIGFFTASGTQTLQIKNNTTLTFNSNTGQLGAASIQVDNININLNTISSTSGNLNLTPVAGSAIVLDGTINVDAGVVTGATSITSTEFVGNLNGTVGGVTPAAGTFTNLVVNGNTTLGDASADTLTINAGTWTYGNNFIATRAVGAAAAGISNAIANTVTFTGDAGGTTDVRGNVYTLTSSGANAITNSFNFVSTTEHAASTNITGAQAGFVILNSITSTGNVATSRGVSISTTLSSSGSITAARNAFQVIAPTLSGTGTILTMRGFYAGNLGHATLVTNAIGYDADNMTAALNFTASYRSLQNSGTNVWAFFHNGTANNAFAGNVRIGSVVAPTVALDVTGAALISTTLTVSGVASNAIGNTASSTTNLILAAGTTGVSSLRVPHGSAPTAPVDGDMWTTTAGLFVRINGATVGPLT